MIKAFADLDVYKRQDPEIERRLAEFKEAKRIAEEIREKEKEQAIEHGEEKGFSK